MPPETHISDEDLILAMDGELDEARATLLNRHLAHCWDCRARRTRFEQSIADYMAMHRSTLGLPIAPLAGPAAKLRATLSRQSQQPVAESGWFWGSARSTALLVAVAMAILIAPLAVLLWFPSRQARVAGPLPDGRLTPGSVRRLSTQQVCSIAPQDEGRLAPPQLAVRVFERYHISNPKPGSYEVDYLISPALGGSDGIENLWPVPYADGVWSSRVKDALEDHLRSLVCSGKVDLAMVQLELSRNWIGTYQKYFKTKEPIAAHASFVKDSPWQ